MLWFDICVSGMSELQIQYSPTDLGKHGVGVTMRFWFSDSKADDPKLHGSRPAGVFLEAKGHFVYLQCLKGGEGVPCAQFNKNMQNRRHWLRSLFLVMGFTIWP